jgi:hypothetical protein
MNTESHCLTLVDGKTALVSPEDYHRVNQHPWRVLGNYVVWAHQPKTARPTYLHRFIMEPPICLQVDHINGDGLDNRRPNLRIVTYSVNQQNSKLRPHSSQYRGVSWDKAIEKWKSRINLLGKFIHLGVYNDEIMAAQSYDEAAVRFYGPLARVNFRR